MSRGPQKAKRTSKNPEDDPPHFPELSEAFPSTPAHDDNIPLSVANLSSPAENSAEKQKKNQKKNLNAENAWLSPHTWEKHTNNIAREQCLSFITDHQDCIVDPHHMYDLSYTISLSGDFRLSFLSFKDIINLICENIANDLFFKSIPDFIQNCQFRLGNLKASSEASFINFNEPQLTLKVNQGSSLSSTNLAKLSAYIVQTFSSFNENISINDQSFLANNQLVLLKMTIPEHVDPLTLANAASKLYSPYGDILFQEEKEKKTGPLITFGKQPFIKYAVLKCSTGVLPPRKNTIINAKQEECEIITSISSPIKHCHYCRSLNHNIKSCSLRPNCNSCSSNHRPMFCPKLSAEQQQSLFTDLPPLLQSEALVRFRRATRNRAFPRWIQKKLFEVSHPEVLNSTHATSLQKRQKLTHTVSQNDNDQSLSQTTILSSSVSHHEIPHSAQETTKTPPSTPSVDNHTFSTSHEASHIDEVREKPNQNVLPSMYSSQGENSSTGPETPPLTETPPYSDDIAMDDTYNYSSDDNMDDDYTSHPQSSYV